MLSNCRQPMTILLAFVGSTQIDGSFAASPRILWPPASTFTWRLVNGPYCETIPDEVSIRKICAGGGLSYFSSGSVRRALGGSACPQRGRSATSEPREANKIGLIWGLIFVLHIWPCSVPLPTSQTIA